MLRIDLDQTLSPEDEQLLLLRLKSLNIEAPKFNKSERYPIDASTILTSTHSILLRREFYDVLEKKRIGSGQYGKVKDVKRSFMMNEGKLLEREDQKNLVYKIQSFECKPGIDNDAALKKWIGEIRKEANIIKTLYGHGEIVGRKTDKGYKAYILMPKLPGESLNKLKLKQMPIMELLKLCVALSKAVEHFHRQGFIHLDLSLNNSMLTPNGQIRLIDFGFSLKVGTDSDIYGKAFLPKTIAPELCVPNLKVTEDTKRAEMPGLAVTLAQILGFKNILKFKTASVESSDFISQPYHFADVPDSLSQAFSPNEIKKIQHLFERMTAPNPSDRPENLDIVVGYFLKLMAQPTATIAVHDDSLKENKKKRKSMDDEAGFVENMGYSAISCSEEELRARKRARLIEIPSSPVADPEQAVEERYHPYRV